MARCIDGGCCVLTWFKYFLRPPRVLITGCSWRFHHQSVSGSQSECGEIQWRALYGALLVKLCSNTKSLRSPGKTIGVAWPLVVLVVEVGVMSKTEIDFWGHGIWFPGTSGKFIWIPTSSKSPESIAIRATRRIWMSSIVKKRSFSSAKKDILRLPRLVTFHGWCSRCAPLNAPDSISLSSAHFRFSRKLRRDRLRILPWNSSNLTRPRHWNDSFWRSSLVSSWCWVW